MNESNLDFYDFNCIKCGAEGTKQFFEFKEVISDSKRRATVYTTKKVKVPVCTQCNLEFEKWVNKHGTSRSSIKDTLWMYCCAVAVIAGVFYAAYYNLTSTYGDPNLFYIFIGVGFLGISALIGITYYIYRKRKSKQEITSPFRYIKFVGKNTYVKPQGTGNWINYDVWLKNTTKIDENKVIETQLKKLQKNIEFEENINVIYCPECGEKFNKGIDFCTKCGKDLRLVEGNIDSNNKLNL